MLVAPTLSLWRDSMGETGKEGMASSSTEAEFASLTALFAQADTDHDGLLSYEAFMPMIRVHASTKGTSSRVRRRRPFLMTRVR